MTEEEAKKVLEMFLHKQCDLARTKFAYDANTVWEAVNMASKLLEQESVLDKIKAEIEQNAFKDVNGSKYIFVNRVNQILDKYKAESEEI